METLEVHLKHQIEHSRNFFWHRIRWRAVQEHLPPGSFELVDVGAGAGLLGEYLTAEVPRASYRFVEPIESLERHLEVRFGTAANANRLDRFAGAEVICLLDVLEHQEDDRGFLAELASKMDSGATLLVTVPSMGFLWSQWDVALGHFRRYDKHSLLEAVRGLPLEVCELSYLFPEMVPAGLLRRLSRGPGDQETPEGSGASSEFPNFPRPLNAALYAAGTVSVRLRRIAPIGSSLLAVLVRA